MPYELHKRSVLGLECSTRTALERWEEPDSHRARRILLEFSKLLEYLRMLEYEATSTTCIIPVEYTFEQYIICAMICPVCIWHVRMESSVLLSVPATWADAESIGRVSNVIGTLLLVHDD